MTMYDVFKVAFVGSFVDLSIAQILLIFGVALICASLICLFYRLSYSGTLFSRSFCASLFAMTLITTLLISAIRTNIYLSLGTLGALSIVRFRTSIKEPMDMAFLFLSISAGIICGANLLGIAGIGVVIIGLILFAVNRLPHTSGAYLLVLNAEGADEGAISACLIEGTRRAKLKSKSLIGTSVEYIWEISLINNDNTVVSNLAAIDGVSSVSCVKSNAEYI